MMTDHLEICDACSWKKIKYLRKDCDDKRQHFKDYSNKLYGTHCAVSD